MLNYFWESARKLKMNDIGVNLITIRCKIIRGAYFWNDTTEICSNRGNYDVISMDILYQFFIYQEK